MKKGIQKKCPSGHFLNRALSIDAIIVKESKILLIRRGNDPYKNYWALPGGYVDWNETVEEAAVREISEETGLKVLKLTVLGIYSTPERHPRESISITFIAETTGAEKAGDDALDVKYFDPGSFPQELAFDHEKIIRDYWEGRRENQGR